MVFPDFKIIIKGKSYIKSKTTDVGIRNGGVFTDHYQLLGKNLSLTKSSEKRQILAILKTSSKVNETKNYVIAKILCCIRKNKMEVL